MPAEYSYFDDADGVVAIPGRSPGGGSIPLFDASKFPAGVWDKPARLVIRRGETLVTILKAVGRSGSALAVDGAVDGYADATVVPGDAVRVSWTKADVAEIHDRLDAAGGGEPGVGVPAGGETGQVLAKSSDADYETGWVDPPAADLSGYPTRTEVDTALATKASTVTTAGLDGRLTTAEGLISGLQTTKADASALADYATTAALADGLATKADASVLSGYATTTALATKENSLPAGSPGQFLAHDKIFRTPPKGLIHLGRWSTSPTAAGSMGEMDGRLVASPVATVPVAAVLSAIANTTGASVQIAVGGSNLFSGPVTLTGGTTAPTAFTSFALGSIPAMAAVKPSITAIGGEVRGFVVDLWGREA